jgi:hypothetical protein
LLGFALLWLGVASFARISTNLVDPKKKAIRRQEECKKKARRMQEEDKNKARRRQDEGKNNARIMQE